MLYDRTLPKPDESFFLLGPRGTVKTTWIKAHWPEALHLDLLEPKLFLSLSREPALLEAMVAPLKPKSWVVIDEIQKIPTLLDSVHRLIESKQLYFILTGSSSRKLKRSGANLLAGRAIMREMWPLISAEMREYFDLDHCLKWGGLPRAVQTKDPSDFLESYFHTYLKEEIREEGVVRQIDPFVRFLEVAANMNGQVLNLEAVARESGSKRPTVEKWFTVLQETLIADILPPWRPGFKVRESAHPKFYWFDNGVLRAAAGRLSSEDIDSSWLGYAFESWVLHEVRAYNSYFRKRKSLFYYSLPSNVDIDLIIETKKATKSSVSEIIGVEIKASKKWKREWERALRDLKSSEKCKVKKMIGVYQGEEILQFGDFEVYPIKHFLKVLHSGELF
jgi:uncharacterized protein